MTKPICIYLVGGAVRDDLLGLPVKERDWVVVGASHQWMLQQNYRPVGKDFPVYLHPKTKEEYALARSERKTGKGYKGFTFQVDDTISIEQDLMRRDLTINAMARDPSGQLIDPFGGYKDLQAGKLQHISSAFKEDPLRVLRVARFAAKFDYLDFTVVEPTLLLMQGLSASGELDYLIPERVWLETEKVLSSRSPWVYFEILNQCDALSVIAPELMDGNFANLITLLKLVCKQQSSPVTRLTIMLGGAFQNREQTLMSLSQRWNIPKFWRQDALLLVHHYVKYQQLAKANKAEVPKLAIDLLYTLDAWRRPENLPKFIEGCQTLDQLYKEPDNNNKTLLLKGYELGSHISTKRIISQGFKGKSIAQQLRIQRIQLVSNTLE